MCNYSELILELAKQRTGLKHDLDDEIILSGLDSLQLIEMAADLEKRFDVRIENERACRSSVRILFFQI